jgi:hypothetical protein
MMADNAFRLSRIQAEGWNAARRIAMAELAELNDREVEALNPYQEDSERIRWNAGFQSALKTRQR